MMQTNRNTITYFKIVINTDLKYNKLKSEDKTKEINIFKYTILFIGSYIVLFLFVFPS